MSTTRTEIFADLLRRHRLEAGLTQEALAERAGLSVRAITDLERGARRAPYRDTAQRLADALALTDADRAAFEGAAQRPRAPVGRAASPWAAAELPEPLTPLLGREREVAEATRLLRRADVRLLTLTGPGGSGKTRLALQVGADLRDDFTDGVGFVVLAPIADPALVLPTIAEALRLPEAPGQPWTERLATALRARHLLLVLDNFEHLLAAAPDLATVLWQCPRVSVLVTSRAALRLTGEREFSVPPLAVPDRSEPATAESLRRYAAVDLFCQRAEAVQPGFALRSENADAVAEITRRLDGLPLAIELAAARSKVLAPTALLQRLDDRLSLLTGGARDLPERHQTLRQAIAWSYDLLDARERALFRRLAVFVGGWTLDAADAVCGERDLGPEIREQTEAAGTVPWSLVPGPSHDVLDGLSSLVDKSLIVEATEPDDEPRFTMLETIQEYAVEQLAAHGEVDAWRGRHAAYYLSLAERAKPDLQAADATETVIRLQREQGNLRAALGWAAMHGYSELVLRLAGAMGGFWILGGYLSEGRRWIEDALTGSGDAPDAVRAEALYVLARIVGLQNRYGRMEWAFEESLSLSRRLGDRAGVARCLNSLGRALLERGDGARAVPLFEESLAIYRDLEEPSGAAWSLLILGDAALAKREVEHGASLYEESLALERGTGDQSRIANALDALAVLRHAQRDYAQAAIYFEQSLTLRRAVGWPLGLAGTLLHFALLLSTGPDRDRAGALLSECLTLSRELGIPLNIASCLLTFGGLAGRGGDLKRAARLFGAGEALLEANGQSVQGTYAGLYTRAANGVRAALGDEAYAAAQAEGRALSFDDAVALALAASVGPKAGDAPVG